MFELGPYRLDVPLGKGGTGEVWSGIHLLQSRPVAVKILTHRSTQDPAVLAAFRNEVRAAAALDHPHIVTVYEYGEAPSNTEESSDGRVRAGTPYLAMELVPGGTLHNLVGRVQWNRVRAVVVALLDALAHAHARGVIHRDLKPGNVLYGHGGVKLTDFGLAHAVEGHLATAERPYLGGTPAYMAPEQFDGRWRDYGPWTDLYGFGCLVFALVRGKPPFGATRSYEEKLRQHSLQQPPPLEPPFAVPAGFESWLRRLLEKDPARRFRRAADAAWAFQELDEPALDAGHPVDMPPAPWRRAEGDTLILEPHTTQGPTLQADATTMSLTTAEIGEASLGLGAVADQAPPMPATWRKDADHREPPSPPGLGLFGLRAVPSVGREQERDALWAALVETRRAKRAGLMVLAGPDGTGKSHLARWLCERAHEVGAATVLRATHGPIPAPSHGLGPAMGNLLRCQGLNRLEVLDRVTHIFRTHGVEHEDEWEALTEVISPATDDAPGTIRFGSALERHVTVRRLLQALTLERPVIFWLDDVQWGLDALRFTEHLLDRQRIHPLPVLILVTTNAAALTERMDEATLLAQLLEREEAQRLDVHPLPRAQFQELVQSLLGLDPKLAAEVGRRSEGNPLFAVQLLEDWVERKVLEVGPAGLRLRSDATELPRDMVGLWRARVERMLSRRAPAEERALELAAVMGTDIDPDEWLAICERSAASGSRLPADPSEELLDALLDARLARAGEGGPARGWSFAHPLLRECLERRAAHAGRLADLHRVCAEVLLDKVSLSATNRLPVGLIERVGGHLVGAGRAEAALSPLLAAARTRLDLTDYVAGQRLLARRRAAMETLDLPLTDPRWGESWVLEHDILHGQGAYEDAEAVLARAEQAASAPGWTEVAAEASARRARLARLAGQRDAALAELRTVELLASTSSDRRLRARARWERGSVLAEHGELTLGERAIRAALADFEAVEDPVGCARAWQSLGEIAKDGGRHPEAAVLLRRAETLFEACGNRWGMASAINSQGDVARYRDDVAAAETLYRRARGLFRAIGSGASIFPEFNLGLVDLARGHASRARLDLERGMDAFVRQGNRSAVVGAHLALAACAAMESRWLEWDEHLEQAVALQRETGVVEEDIARTSCLAGRCASDGGQAERARAAYLLAWSSWTALHRSAEVSATARALDALGPWTAP